LKSNEWKSRTAAIKIKETIRSLKLNSNENIGGGQGFFRNKIETEKKQG